jgi:hypothetical protein
VTWETKPLSFAVSRVKAAKTSLSALIGGLSNSFRLSHKRAWCLRPNLIHPTTHLRPPRIAHPPLPFFCDTSAFLATSLVVVIPPSSSRHPPTNVQISATDRLSYRAAEYKRKRSRGAMQASSPSWKEGAFTKSKVQLPWRSMKLLVPHRLRRKLRSKIRNRQSPASSLTALQTSINPLDTLRALQAHKWTIWDGQYLFLAFLGIFSLCVIQNPGPLIKTVVATLLMSSLVLPITRQFFLPALPIFAWLIFFYACQ